MEGDLVLLIAAISLMFLGLSILGFLADVVFPRLPAFVDWLCDRVLRLFDKILRIEDDWYE